MWFVNTVNSMNNDNLKHARILERVNASLKRRYARERRFRLIGLSAVMMGLLFVSFLFISIVGNGYTAFQQTYIKLHVEFDESLIDPSGERNQQQLSSADYAGLVKASLRKRFPEVKKRGDKKKLYNLVSSAAALELRTMVLEDPALIGTSQSVWVLADDDIDMLVKGHIDRNLPEDDRRVKDQVVDWVDRLASEGAVEKQFNTTFFTAGDSREPEQAGIGGAVAGSFYVLIVTLLLSFPIGVATAVYLEEFAPQNRFTDLVEVNINNLAAVPSIVFGLLGLAVFINFFELPRSAPLVGAYADDPAHHHHCQPCRPEVGTPFHSGGCPGCGCIEDADGFSSCIAVGHARYADRNHYRHGPGTGRECSLADDRHGGLYCRYSRWAVGSVHGAAGSDLSLG